MPYTTRELLARLIKCEAGGEGDDGMAAVASVVRNRADVPYGEFFRVSQGGDIRKIIEQPGQFVCMRSTVGGEYNSQNVWNMDPEEIHYQIADWVLAGTPSARWETACFSITPTVKPALLIFLRTEWGWPITESTSIVFIGLQKNMPSHKGGT